MLLCRRNVSVHNMYITVGISCMFVHYTQNVETLSENSHTTIGRSLEQATVALNSCSISHDMLSLCVLEPNIGELWNPRPEKLTVQWCLFS